MNQYNHLQKLKEAYDETVTRRNKGIDEESLLPQEFKESERYIKFKQETKNTKTNSSNPEIVEYLNPKKEMKFLDIGSNANLITKNLGSWPSLYYGIDISPELIRVTKKYVEKNKLKIGGLYEMDVRNMDFKDNFFDISASIGVFEYFDINFIEEALREISRVLKPNAKFVVDMPNFDHQHVEIMQEREKYLGRVNKNTPKNTEFETILKKYFEIDSINDQEMMKNYFVRNRT